MVNDDALDVTVTKALIVKFCMNTASHRSDF